MINMSHIVEKLKKNHGWSEWPLPYPKLEHQKEREKYEKSHKNLSKVLQFKRYE